MLEWQRQDCADHDGHGGARDNATDDNIGQTTTMSISNAQPAPLRAIVQGRINPITAKPRIHALHAVYKMRALLTPREVVRA